MICVWREMNGVLKTADTEEVSLRPLSLRPGGPAKNPFASFGKGAGAAFRDKVGKRYVFSSLAVIGWSSVQVRMNLRIDVTQLCKASSVQVCLSLLTPAAPPNLQLRWWLVIVQPKEDIFAPPVEEKKKPRGEVIKYTAEFLHSLSEVPCPIFGTQCSAISMVMP